MKISRRMAFCGIISAIALVTMLLSAFPYISIGLAALAGASLVPAALEIKTRYGLLCYAAVSLVGLLIVPDQSVKWLFIFFLGYYPILQLRINLWHHRTWIWVAKLLLFNVTCIGAFLFVTYVLGSRDALDMFVEYPIIIVALPIANVLFIIYDVALTSVVAFYRVRIHPIVTRFLR